jgi:ABC-2 type transport system permease protein
VTAAAVALPRADARPAPLRRAYRFELVKLLAQWPIRLVLLACWLGPALLVAVISQQSSLPADTVFGRWLGQTGWAGPLVVLSFSCSWVLPLLTCLVAGDAFAVEDRLGTWRHLLVAVRSPRRIFVAKALATLTVIILLVAGLASSSVVGGLAAVGNRPLVGLDGHLLAPGQAAGAVLLAWASVLAPTLAFAAVGLLGSVALGRSPMGLVIPALLALLLQIAQLLPLPVAVRVALPSYAFIAWRGLFTSPAQTGPLLVGVAVSLAWAMVASALAYLLFMRRDFTDTAYDGLGRRVAVRAVLPLAALLAITVGVIAAASSASGSGIDKAKLDNSLETAFAHLYRMQTAELHRPDVTEAQLRTSASCDKGGPLVDDLGPGNDWRCVVTWQLPDATATGSAIYQLDVGPDGRYVADGDGPQEVNGFFRVHTATGDAPNPLWQFDGSIDLLTAYRPRQALTVFCEGASRTPKPAQEPRRRLVVPTVAACA